MAKETFKRFLIFVVVIILAGIILMLLWHGVTTHLKAMTSLVPLISTGLA
jgi:hypothetical protein